MNQSGLVKLNRLAVTVGGLFAVVGSAVAISIAGVESWFASYGGFMALLSLAFAVLVWLLIPQQPRNAMIWTLSAASLGTGLWLIRRDRR